MEKKESKFEVKVYYSGFCTYEISAKDENEAILIARSLDIKRNEFLSTLENWKEADTATEIENEKSKI